MQITRNPLWILKSQGRRVYVTCAAEVLGCGALIAVSIWLWQTLGWYGCLLLLLVVLSAIVIFRRRLVLATRMAQIQALTRPEDLPRRIALCRRVLETADRKTSSRQRIWLHTEMANGLLASPFGNRAENIEQVIHHCQQALEVCTRGSSPEQWVSIQNILSGAYNYRIRGERAENIEQAIYHFHQALEVCTREDFPEQWATIQNNLANSYLSRIQGERTDNIEQAIYHSQQALEVRTRESLFPELWANTQSNLASAYAERIRGEQAENIEQAIYHFHQALEVCTREDFPEQWATFQSNLAAAYVKRIRGKRVENIERAISCYQQVLEVNTREDFPELWANTQNNLASAYAERIRDEQVENIERAIFHYQQALEVYTVMAFPAEHRRIKRDVGYIYSRMGNWRGAHEALRGAIETGDNLLAAAYTETGRQSEVGEIDRLYSNTAYCLVQEGQYGQALYALEQGKTRLLAEALALENADLGMLPDHQRRQVLEARQAVRDLEAAMRLSPESPAHRGYRTLAGQLGEVRAHLNHLVDSVRKDHPDFMTTSLDLPGILERIPVGGALVAPLTTSFGSILFIVPGGAKQVTSKHIIQLDRFTDQDLADLLSGSEKREGWRHAYYSFRRSGRLEDWQAAIETFNQELWEVLIAPAHARLQALGAKRILLMPQGGLQLLPLHAAWREVKGQKRALVDDYEISYAPSFYALDVCHRHAAGREGKTALIVGINTYRNLPPLSNARAEAESIAAIFHAKPLLDDAATVSAVRNASPRSAYLHLSCHGSYGWGRSPLDSSLYLAEDTPLTLSQIVSGALDLQACRLVALSACETGITDVIRSPDEYIGLPAGFLQAGAATVVSSLWTVDDRSTTLLMERFYHNHLERGMGFAAALREAQLWVRDDADEGRYAHPYYWAAFTCTGVG